MNDYVSDLTDYNKRGERVEKLPFYWEDRPSEPLNCFYDFAAEKPVRIIRFGYDNDEFSPFQKKLLEYCKKL